MTIDTELFYVEIHLGGYFDLGPPKRYIDGSIARLNNVHGDDFDFNSIRDILVECEYENDFKVYCRMHENSIDDSFKILNTNESLYDVFMEHQSTKRIVLYIEHRDEDPMEHEIFKENEIGSDKVVLKNSIIDEETINIKFQDSNKDDISDSNEAMRSTPKSSGEKERTHEECTPIVDDNNRPKIGMKFSSLENGKQFYYAYAKLGGFSVRKGSSNLHRKTRELVAKYYFCSKEGESAPSKNKKNESAAVENKDETVEKLPVKSSRKRRRSVVRDNCMALIKFKKVEDGMWEIVKLHEGHCHILTSPRRQHFLRTNREVSSTHKSLIQVFDEANISTSQLVTVLNIQSNGYGNVGCIERDIRNYKRDVRKAIKETDAHIFLENFEKIKSINPSFFYEYKVDNENKLTHVFWADGLSRKAYQLFGDVVVFDTTYETNKYSMIFAPFTGVNHHRQSVNFGVGFLKDEKAESFIWLFEKFLEAMGGMQPPAFITDQCPSIGSAIKNVFDKTKHRYCMWHILNKLSGKVGAVLSSNKVFNEDFSSCVWFSETPGEFEKKWDQIIKTYNLEENDWLKTMYEQRDIWIPAFFKDTFLAGMRTTQRSESMNSFFSHFINQRNSLVEFQMRFERALEQQRHNELKADHDTIYTKPKMKFKNSLEKQMAEIYTHANFYLFQDELFKSCVNCAAKRVKEEGDMALYIVQESENKKRQSREVIYEISKQEVSCDCKMFESEGIPCRHVLVVLKNEFVDELPNHYIMRRWTKLATSFPIFDAVGNELYATSKNISGSNLSQLFDVFSECMHLAGCSNELFLHAMERGKNLKNELLEMKTNLGDDLNDKRKNSSTNDFSSDTNVHPPDISKTKGSGKRLKGGKEKAIEKQEKQKRLCRACNQLASHDSRNCPQKKNS